MSAELDHLFICTDPGAPAADELVRMDFREAAPNRHAGQGTANRRFAFANAMIEFLWVCDKQEAQSEVTQRTLLWRRWSGREGTASPFGVCLRPADSLSPAPPFPAWEYQPAYLLEPLVMHIAETDVKEPMWVYLNFMRRANREQHFTEHPIGVREITGLTLTTIEPLLSSASESVIRNGIATAGIESNHLLEIHFDGERLRETVDFRPRLPIVFRF